MKTSQKVPSLLTGLVLTLFVATSACGPADTATDEPNEDAQTAEATASEPDQATGWVGDVNLGTDVAADGTVPAGAVTDRVPLGEIVFLSVAVDEPPAGAQLRVTFLGPDGQVVAEDGKRVSPDAEAVFVSSGPTGDWTSGSYRAEVWLGAEKVAEASFELTDGA